MKRFCVLLHVVLLLSLMAAAPQKILAQASPYTITQVTTGPVDHLWPALNNKNDIVWSQQVGSLYQVFRLNGTGGTPTAISVPDANHNFRYPDISDAGNITYLKDTSGGGTGLEVILNQGGTESILEFSSSNVSGAYRNAGLHSGISKSGTTISYYDFCNQSCVRRFDVSGVGTLQCGASACDFTGQDFPDIDNGGDIVYTNLASSQIEKISTQNLTPTAIAPGTFSRINNSGDIVVVAGGVVQIYAAPKYATGNMVHAGSWAGINDFGTVVFQAPDASGHQQIFKAVPSNSISLLDPIPALLCGQASVIDPAAQCGNTKGSDLLASQGTPVQGVAADGVTQLVVRISTANAGDQFTLTVVNDQNQPSISTNDDGGLATIPLGTVTSQITTMAVNTINGPMAFAIYQSPLDFPRATPQTVTCGGIPGQDPQLPCRPISIQVNNQTSGASSTTKITILRPPVILIHGIWDDSSTWNCFSPLINFLYVPPSPTLPNGECVPIGTDSRFSVGKVDYSYPVGNLISLVAPAYPQAVINFIAANAGANSLGFNYNATHFIPTQIQSWIDTFKTGSNPAGLPVAAIQADLVAHSMGGNITRTFPLQPGFLSASTLGQGFIHKVITIDSPHLGTPLATQLLNGQNNCVRNLLALRNKFSFSSVVLSGNPVSGAVFDLTGDGSGATLSSALNNLKQSGYHQLPIAFITGILNSSNLATAGTNSSGLLIQDICAKTLNSLANPLALALSPNGWPTIFGQPSDGIVPLSSQFNNLSVSSGYQNFGFVHSGGTEDLSFTGPSVIASPADYGSLSFSPALLQTIPNQVINLLNTPLTNPPQAPFYLQNP